MFSQLFCNFGAIFAFNVQVLVIVKAGYQPRHLFNLSRSHFKKQTRFFKIE